MAAKKLVRKVSVRTTVKKVSVRRPVKKVSEAQQGGRVPAYLLKSTSVQSRLKPNQHFFKHGNRLFVLEKWGSNQDKTHHFGLLGVAKDGEKGTKGGFMALVDYKPLKEKIPGVENAKAWKISASISSKELLDEENSVLKRLVKMVQLKAGADGVNVLVAKPFLQKDAAPVWESMGFKKSGTTGFFVKKLS